MREILSQFINRFKNCKMKKLVLFAVVALCVSLSACKKAAPAEEAVQEETITVAVDEPATEGALEETAVDSVVVEEEAAQ
jgi:maltose-binding protein MalE